MNTVYIEKNSEGKIIRLFSSDQPGFDLTPINEQDPAVLAYLADPLGLNDSFPSLKKWQLWLAALELPTPIFKAEVLAAVAGMPDFSDVEKETIRIMIEDAQEYAREDPRIDVLAQVMGISPAEMDTLWRWAASFSPM
jgi:hypothetical protein